ncbi:MAG: hypothetical protein ACRC33_31210 [Gemmataceae bacterium]
MFPTLILLGVLATLAGVGLYWLIRVRNLDRWLGTYVRESGRWRDPASGQDVHLLICVSDHFEPKYGGPPAGQAAARVRRWVEEYPRQFARFRDSSGRTPRHTFFYPCEEYEPEYLDGLARLCSAGFGEVEIHLHHDRDTADNMRRTLGAFRDTLAARHGLLARRRDGAVAYAFIHGNWALCNSMPGGRHCGVDNELAVLLETGCYVDMTLPSAPSPAQTPVINRVYHAKDRPGPCAHFHPCPPGEGLMLIQGPLLLDWGRRKLGLIPRVENGCLQASQPATMERVRLWLRAGVRVDGRPDWYFAKLHAHGAVEDAHDVLLGEPMVRFHEGLAEEARRNPHFHFHYVTAREMYNLARAAESGYAGPVAGALDYELLPGPAAAPCPV